MFILNDKTTVNLDNLSEILAACNIEKLNIISIIDTVCTNVINISTNKGSDVYYTEFDIKNFIEFLNIEENKFININPYTLYIIRGGIFLDLKNLFSNIDGYKVTVGRGGSQKSHILSPLDLRLSFYMMAIFGFNYETITNLNAFHNVDKSVYLSYTDNFRRYKKNNVSVRKVLSKL